MRQRALVADRDALSAEIAGLSKAGIKDLRERWKTLCGKEPSGRIGRSFLIRVIAYRLQEEAFGGSPDDHRRPLVGTAVLRPEASSQGGGQWLTHRSDVVQFIPASPLKKDWTKITTRCMRSAKRAKRSSGARRAK